MAVMTGLFPGGCCDNIKWYSDRIECTPRVSKGMIEAGTTNLHYEFRCKIIGDPNERVNVVMHWPEFNLEHVTKEATYWFVQSFAEVAEHVFFTSTDEIHWTRLDGIKKNGWDFNFTVTVPEEGFIYVVVNLPFTYTALQAVCKEFSSYRVPLGKTTAGMDIPMFQFGNGKNVVWLQANVHIIEMSGCHALVGLMRYLVNNLDAINDFTFFVIPSLAVDGLIGDMRIDAIDINRDYGLLSRQETQAIDHYLRSLVKSGHKMLVMSDFHNGWCRKGDSGSNITEFNKGFVEEEYYQKRLRFTKAFLQATDLEKPDRIWWHDYGKVKTFFMYGVENYQCYCSTIEFSRYQLWNRKQKCFVPVTQELLEKFGEDYAKFILSYDYEL